MQTPSNEFLTPRHIDVQSVSPTRARITLEPLERGFGHTLGNALRRILLSSMSGAAVVPFQHVRRGDGGYTLKLWPALDHFPGTDATADTARIIAAIETMTRAAPEQYLWVHRRFKRQPGKDARALYD